MIRQGRDPHLPRRPDELQGSDPLGSDPCSAESLGARQLSRAIHAVVFSRRCAFLFGHVSFDSTETTPGIRSVYVTIASASSGVSTRPASNTLPSFTSSVT